MIGVIILHKLKNIKLTFLKVLLAKLFVLIINSVSQLSFYRGKIWFIDSLKKILKEYDYRRGAIKKHFNKNLVMSERDE